MRKYTVFMLLAIILANTCKIKENPPHFIYKLYEFDPLIEEIAKKHNIDPVLIRAIIIQESGCNPYAVSRKGAKGLMQITHWIIKKYKINDPFDPYLNIYAGTLYFKELLNKFKDVNLALAAYNAGPTAVKKYKGIPPYRETKRFVRKVLKYYEILKRYYKT